MWLDTQSQYCWIDDTPTTTTKTYQIDNWRILYTILDAFNGRYLIGDGIGEGFNGKSGIGDGFDSTAIKGGRYFELVCSAGSVWLDTQSQYRGIW